MHSLLASFGIDHVVEKVTILSHEYSRNKTPRKQTKSGCRHFDRECKIWRQTMLYFKHNIRGDNACSQMHKVVTYKKRLYIKHVHSDLVLKAERKPYVFLKQHNGVYISNALSSEQIERFLIETFTRTNATIKIQNMVAIHCSNAHCNTHSYYLNTTSCYLNTSIQVDSM